MVSRLLFSLSTKPQSDSPSTLNRTGILLPTETIVFASPVLVRRGLFTKKRSLILTDYPRLICIKDAPTKVTLKSEVFVGAALKGGVTKPGAVAFIRAEKDGHSGFFIKTVSRLYFARTPLPRLLLLGLSLTRLPRFHSLSRPTSTRNQREQPVDGLMSYERRMRKGLERRLAGELAFAERAEGRARRVRWTLYFFQLRFFVFAVMHRNILALVSLL